MIKLPEKVFRDFLLEQNEIINTGFYSEGEPTARAETILTNYINIFYPRGVLVNSCGSGIFLTLKYLIEIRKIKTVYVQSNTFYGVPQIVRMFPQVDLIYIKSDDYHFSMSLEGLSSHQLTDSVVLLSHIGGHPNTEIDIIAERCKMGINCYLIEDCAHSFDATFKGRQTGTFGYAGVFSFYSTKSLPAGEGGLIISTDEDLIKYARSFLIYDRISIMKVNKTSIPKGSLNLRMSNTSVAFLMSVFKNWKTLLGNKKKIVNHYLRFLPKTLPHPIYSDPNITSNYYKFLLNTTTLPAVYSNILKLTGTVYDYSCSEIDKQLGGDRIKPHICLYTGYDEEYLDLISQF